MIAEVATHLWQCTLFTGAAWLITLTLRTNRAQVRYWVWLAASVKFLAPYSAFIALGGLVSHGPAATKPRPEWIGAVQQWSQAPSLSSTAAFPPVPPAAAVHSSVAAAGFGLWAAGFIAIALCWLTRWRRVRTTWKSAYSVELPGAPSATPVMAAPGLEEPGVFGVWRPVLLLPEGLSDRLNRAQLDAIVAHEMSHIKRRDNLAAMAHMAAQAIFWFHPFTWWIGARLVDERERACDEEVLRLGYAPGLYANALLAVCKLCVSSPLACVSGVGGRTLRRRIEMLMAGRDAVALNLRKKAGLALAATVSVALPVFLGFVGAPSLQGQSADATGPRFAAASVKECKQEPDTGGRRRQEYTASPGRVRIECIALDRIIFFAYGGIGNMNHPLLNDIPGDPNHVRGGPGWIRTQKYTIEATADGGPDRTVMMGPMLRLLLEDRFQLKTHRETEEAPMYALTTAKGGLKIQPIGEDGCTSYEAIQNLSREAFMAVTASAKPPCGNFTATGDGVNRKWSLGGESMAGFAGVLSGVLDRFVMDKTGIEGTFNINLVFGLYDENVKPGVFGGRPNREAPAGTENGISIFTALEDELGLKIDKARGPREFLVIDHVQRPSEN